MFDLQDVAKNQESKAVDKKATVPAPTRDVLGRNYFTNKGLNSTACADFCLAIAYRLMQKQGVEIVPLEIILAVSDILNLKLRTVKQSAATRTRKHIADMNIATLQDARYCSVSGKGKDKVSTPYTLTGYLLDSDVVEKVDNLIYDFPVDSLPLKGDFA